MAELIMNAQDCIRGFLRAHVAASPRRQLLVPAQTAFYCMQLLLRDLATVAHADDAQMAQVRAATERLGHASMCSGGSVRAPCCHAMPHAPCSHHLPAVARVVHVCPAVVGLPPQQQEAPPRRR